MTSTGGWGREFTVWPQGASRPLPAEVEASFAEDFSEAVAVLGVSPKASAALSRRLLQRLLEEKAGVSHGDLYGEIQQVLDSGELPSWLGNDLDAVRQLGNLAAHPMKSTHTGEIQDVDPGEAEWLLDVMESLFDFYFVGPAKAQAKRDALNEKLAEVNKPPLRTQSP
jgi:hypothetical protein